MNSIHLAWISGILFGIGLGTVFLRMNLIGVLLGVVTSSIGLLLSMAGILSRGEMNPQFRDQSPIFLVAFLFVQVLWLVVGCGVIYRRFEAVGQTSIEKGNELQH